MKTDHDCLKQMLNYMRNIFIILVYCSLASNSFGQTNPIQQEFVIKRQRIFDNEKIFTAGEIRQLDSSIAQYWKKEVADIVIVTIDDRHTTKENFDNYVRQQLTGYASGNLDKNNGIVIAISKKLRRIRIENGYGIEKVLSNAATKKIIDEQFIPKFKEEKYFEGTLNGLNTIISNVEKVMNEEDFIHVSSIFTPSIFKKIRAFVLANGEPQTFRNLDSNNPSYSFTSLDVFLGPSRKNSFVLKDFREEDYYEMTIRDNDSSYYQFIYFEETAPEQTFMHRKMLPGKIYWWHAGDKLLSSDVWPLLAQIENEIAQKSVVNEAKPFDKYDWILKQEFHPMEHRYADIENNDTLSFDGNCFSVNGKQAGTFHMNPTDRILSLQLKDGKQHSFAIFKLDQSYNYRYLFNKEGRKLYLVPLDEREGNDLICVEGRTLLLEIVEP
ncbi:TPM domain-containing protein [Sphingobacterium spiritivorum]|uniref:TPM domain-containing protein n=1 Tax=Sphingobacterium spiritivorum TaxID=258 RepID=UPI003DA35257